MLKSKNIDVLVYQRLIYTSNLATINCSVLFTRGLSKVEWYPLEPFHTSWATEVPCCHILRSHNHHCHKRHILKKVPLPSCTLQQNCARSEHGRLTSHVHSGGSRGRVRTRSWVVEAEEGVGTSRRMVWPLGCPSQRLLRRVSLLLLHLLLSLLTPGGRIRIISQGTSTSKRRE